MSNGSGEWAYLFEAKGIERYLMHSSHLRDMVAASDLISDLAFSRTGDDGNPIHHSDDRIGQLLADLEISNPDFSRRAGGAFCIHGEKAKLAKLRACWRAEMFRNVPGLEFSDALAQGNDDHALAPMRACFAAQGGIRDNYLTDALPLGRAGHDFAARTGLPIAAIDEGDELDIVALAQRDFADRHRRQGANQRYDHAHISAGDRFAPFDNVEWPLDFDRPDFPWLGADRRIAVIHADVSGLGVLFRQHGDEPNSTASGNLRLATAIEGALCAAARAATETVLCPAGVTAGQMLLLPARPFLLGGDDITIVVRADLAIPYAERLLSEIEQRTSEVGCPLTACAGIAVFNYRAPWSSASILAHDLCKRAKAAAKRGRGGPPYPSAYYFFVQTQNAPERLDAIASAYVDKSGRPLWGGPYSLGEVENDLPGSGNFGALADAVAALFGGASRVRKLRGLTIDDRDAANAEWARWRDYAARHQPEAWQTLAQLLGNPADCPQGSSGLFDAAIRLDLEHRGKTNE